MEDETRCYFGNIRWSINKSFVNKKVKKQLRESKAGYPEFIQCRYEEYQERLLAITDKMV